MGKSQPFFRVAWKIAFATAAPVPVIPISPMPRAPSGSVRIGDIDCRNVDFADISVQGDVIVAQVGVRDAAGSLIDLGVFVQREADSPQDTPDKLHAGGSSQI